MIARILAQDPKVVILDEPISYLDIRNQLEIMSLLKRITRNLNLTTILVLHDLNVAMRYADRFVFLKDGRLYLSGGREMINAETIKRYIA
jgi:iron complex transport system ATP-binding protein